MRNCSDADGREGSPWRKEWSLKKVRNTLSMLGAVENPEIAVPSLFFMNSYGLVN